MPKARKKCYICSEILNNDRMEALDQDILLLINGANHPYFDCLMSLISGKLTWLPLYLIILYEFYRRHLFSRQLLAILATVGVTFFLTDFCCSHVIRPMFMRLRPVCLDNPIHTMVHAVEGYRHKSYGFPSCHASNTFGLATLCWLFFRNKWNTFAMFAWATVVCYSRVYIGVHYPGDVLCGAVIGFLIGVGMYYLSTFLQRKYLKSEESGNLSEEGQTKKQQPLIAFAVAASLIAFAIFSIK